MPQSVTVTFDDGSVHVFENVPDNVSPNEIEAIANQQFPGRRATDIAGGDIMLREMRDAIASRQSSLADLRQIADRYGRTFDEDAAQQWLDFAADRPDFEIPQDIVTPPVSRTGAVSEGFMRGVQNVADVISRFAASLADRFGLSPSEAVSWAAENLSGYSPEDAAKIARNLSSLNSFEEVVSAGARAREARPATVQAQTQRPNYFTGGQITGEVFGTAPATAVSGAGLARLGTMGVRATEAGTLARRAARAAQQTGRAVQTGGVGVRAPGMGARAAIASGAPVAASRAGRMALRVAGGGTAGVIGGALTDQDLDTSALVGGAIPIVGTIGRRGAGVVFDALRSRLGEVRAAEVMRNLIADNATAIMEALRTAPAAARANTAQFLAERGLLTPELAAATRIVSATGENAPLLEVAQRRAAGQQEMRNVLMGGPTRTEGVAATNAMRQGVRAMTDPMREEALGLADVGRLQIIPAERQAQALDAVAAEINRSGFVRRMRGLEGRTEEQIQDVFAHPELYSPSTAGRMLPRLGEIADQAGQRADDAITAQLGLRDAARAQREAAENLRAQGLQPLDISSVVGRLRQQAAEAEFVNPPRFRVLSSFADNLEARARSQGGVIDATGLYELRKSMGDTVADLLGPIDPSALQRRTAEIVGETTPLIDDAIEAAGGTGWRQYLNTFSAGMRDVERAQFAGALEQLAARQPQRFEQVMSGNDPKFVSDFFGPGRYDINAELFGSQLPVAQRLSRELGADLDVSAAGLRGISQPSRGPLAAGVRRNVQEIMQPGMNMMGRMLFRAPEAIPGVSAAINATNLEQAIANRMARSTTRQLAPALADPSRAINLLEQRSTNAMLRGAVDALTPFDKAFIAATGRQYGITPPPPAPPASEDIPAGQVFLGYETLPSGERYPVYGYPRVAP